MPNHRSTKGHLVALSHQNWLLAIQTVGVVGALQQEPIEVRGRTWITGCTITGEWVVYPTLQPMMKKLSRHPRTRFLFLRGMILHVTMNIVLIITATQIMVDRGEAWGAIPGMLGVPVILTPILTAGTQVL